MIDVQGNSEVNIIWLMYKEIGALNNCIANVQKNGRAEYCMINVQKNGRAEYCMIDVQKNGRVE